MDARPDATRLLELARMPMPFGRYRGRLLIDLPEPYVVWLYRNALPRGRLGELIRELYEIKVNGLEPLLAPLRESASPSALAAPMAAAQGLPPGAAHPGRRKAP